jgi:hypothetical protein
VPEASQYLPSFHPQTALSGWGGWKAFLFADALTGVCVFAAIGIGKTSSPAQHIAYGSLAADTGRQHSYYISTSPFDFRLLPRFFRRNRRIARYLDLIVCILFGLAILPYLRALEMWLILSGFCLRSFEYAVHQKQRNMDLDVVDALVVSECQSQVVEQFEESHDAGQQQPVTGIPTGLGQDVREHINRRNSDQVPPRV